MKTPKTDFEQTQRFSVKTGKNFEQGKSMRIDKTKFYRKTKTGFPLGSDKTKCDVFKAHKK